MDFTWLIWLLVGIGVGIGGCTIAFICWASGIGKRF